MIMKKNNSGCVVKLKSDAPQYNFYKEVCKWFLIWLTTLFGLSFLVFAVIKLLS